MQLATISPLIHTRIPCNVTYEHIHRDRFCIKWERKSQNVFKAVAYLAAKIPNSAHTSINCPLYVGRSAKEAIQYCIDFVELRGKNSTHDDVKWNTTNMDFNVEFSKEYWDQGRRYTHYHFIKHGTETYMILNRDDDTGHPLASRRKDHTVCGSGASRGELTNHKLSLGRYETFAIPKEQAILLGGKVTDQWFELQFVSEVEHQNERCRLGTPGVTISKPRTDQLNATSERVNTNWAELTGYKKVLKQMLTATSGSRVVDCPKELSLDSFASAVRNVVCVNEQFKSKFSITQQRAGHTLTFILK